MELPRIGVFTIQGGGAVAIDLIGQLQGLTGPQWDDRGNPTGDHGVLPAGVAGTSAGAIIATLYWSGYRPEEIRDQVVELFAPARINGFFGRGGPLGIRFTGFTALADAFAAFLRGPMAFLGHLLWPGWRRWWLFPIWWLWQGLSLPFRFLAAIAALLLRRGVFPGDGLVQAVDRLLRDSRLLAPHRAALPAEGLLCFADVARLNEPSAVPLFLIATDLRGADMAILSSTDPHCGDIRIAEAVRASAGFPGFFQPRRLSETFDVCVDGGVISNFPAWVFGFGYRRRLRASGRPLLQDLACLPWLHVGLRLPPATAPLPTGFDGFMRSLGGLLIGRARARLDDRLAAVSTKRRSVEPQAAPAAEAPSGVLDFGFLSDPARVTAAFDRGRRCGQNALGEDCFALPPPAAIRPILAALARSAEILLAPWRVPGSKIRVNIFLPEGDDMVIAYHINMDGDRDEHLRLRWDEGVTSLVYRKRAAMVADLRGRRQSGGAAPAGADLYLDRAGAPAIETDRTWLLSMPMLDVTEMEPDAVPAGAASPPFSLDLQGPVLGVMNIDAAIDYDRPAAPEPAAAADHPAVLALFDGMKSAALKCSIEFNRLFLE